MSTSCQSARFRVPTWGQPPASVHSFRTSFKSWAAETGVRDEVSEAALALAYADQNQVCAVYRRTSYVEERHSAIQMYADLVGPLA